MTLRDDIRDYFEREARRLPAPTGLRGAITSRAAAARPGANPAIRWAAVVAAMLAVAIVAGLVATGAFKASRREVPAGPPISVTPGAHGFVFDVSFANASDGWALLGDPADAHAQFYVEATHDGGKTWLRPVAIGTPGIGAGQPRHIHFVYRDDGFVYGGQFVLATHDGGRMWVGPNLPSDVVAITGQEGVTWSASANCPVPNCPYSVYVSPDGGKSWSRAAPVPVVPRDARSFGIAGLLVMAKGSSDLAITTDDGATWTKIAGPCPAGTGTNEAGTPDGQEIWEVCSSSPPSAPTSQVFVSEDSGKTWQQRAPTFAGFGVDAVLAPTPGTVLVASDTSNGMAISHDGGMSWSRCATDPRNAAIESVSYSADGSVAVAIDNVYVVWISIDGGNTWNKTTSQP